MNFAKSGRNKSFGKRVAELQQETRISKEGFAHECGFQQELHGSRGARREKYHAGDGEHVRKSLENAPLKII